MKREREDALVCHLAWPLELCVEVARHDWAGLSGPMARTCRAALALFVQRDVLGAIVHACVARGRMLRWLLLALPCGLMPGAPVCDTVECGEAVTHLRHAFVTGGAVAQAVYQKAWLGDVDIWCTDSDGLRDLGGDVVTLDVGEKTTLVSRVEGDVGVDVDIVRVAQYPERRIERFDLSVVQQGYFHATGEAYCTPLALFSYQWRELVALPSRECIEYFPFGLRHNRPGQGRTVDVWYYIEKHHRRHHVIRDKALWQQARNTYHSCTTCQQDPSTGHAPFMRWRARMQTYVARFDDFAAVHYCHAPREWADAGVALVSVRHLK